MNMCEKMDYNQEGISYVKSFSNLGDYQQAYQVTYRLQQQNAGWLLCVQQEKDVSACARFLLHLSERQAKQVVALFYENAVELTLCQDLLDELHIPYGDVPAIVV